MIHKITYILVCFSILLIGCRDDELVMPTEYEIIYDVVNSNSEITGMYLLNEGNMGSNKSTLDYLDFTEYLYIRNLYAERNPTVVKELGDVGNDIKIYGTKLYAVINASNKVEVMNAYTTERITQIEIPNCRYINFYRGYAYVTSYAGGISIDPNAPLGTVYKIDTTNMSIAGKVTVGYQPDELEVLGQYLYVANSGGYRAPNYDNRVSVIEFDRFKQVRQIPVGINLHRIKADKYGKLWVTSRGDYNNVSSKLFVLDKKVGYNDMIVTDTLNISCSNMAIQGDSLFFYSTEWNDLTQKNTISYGIINVKTKELVSKRFITDGTESSITVPYGIAIHPESGDIYVTDAKNYVSSGVLNCYTKDGKRKWKVRTGDIPASMAFLPKRN